jgi:hypothetical protein
VTAETIGWRLMKKIVRHYRIIKSEDKKKTEKKQKPSQIDNYVSYYELFKATSK